MKTSLQIIGMFVFLILASVGCSSDLSRTHRGDLLDDKVTTQRVQSALQRAGNDFQNIQVQTTNGVVVLNGTVATKQTRSRAEQIVRNVHRADGMENNLQVRK